ncbi:MAG: NAD(P)/FAD-dependent oxidoreductase [Propionibacteriaceae bacterium]|nr:NAD(P)/FAD-dependent oxidoreductase [Propionibacteriaceae bacterium]
MPEVVVVGAGISGLAAAWQLNGQGIETTVLEAAPRPGGRIHSLEVNGCTVEVGANFITDAYRIVPQLAAELGLEVRSVSDLSAVAIAGHLYPFTANRPISAVHSGLLTWRSVVASLPGLTRFGARYRRRGTVDPLDWDDLDHTPTRDWGQELRLGNFVDRAWRPAYHGFYFQDVAATSAAAVAAMAAHGLRQKTLTIPGGLSKLTDALATRLDVRVQEQVLRVERRVTGVTLHTTSGVYRARKVIVATPGPAVAGLWDLDPLEHAVTEVPYSTGLLVALGIGRVLRADELGGAYGVLLAPDECDLAALAVASRAGHAAPGRDVVTCMFTSDAAQALAAASDAEIVQAASDQVLAWAPEVRDVLLDPGECVVQRIPHAMPTSPLGRLAHIAAYRRTVGDRRVVLAGDSLAWPWTDSAAFTGQWAAEAVASAS